MSQPDPPEGPGDQRVMALLAPLRTSAPATPEHFTRALTRRLRAQRAARTPLRILGSLLGAVVDVVAAAVGRPRGSGR